VNLSVKRVWLNMTSEILYLKSSSTLSLDVKKKTDRKRA